MSAKITEAIQATLAPAVDGAAQHRADMMARVSGPAPDAPVMSPEDVILSEALGGVFPDQENINLAILAAIRESETRILASMSSLAEMLDALANRVDARIVQCTCKHAPDTADETAETIVSAAVAAVARDAAIADGADEDDAPLVEEAVPPKLIQEAQNYHALAAGKFPWIQPANPRQTIQAAQGNPGELVKYLALANGILPSTVRAALGGKEGEEAGRPRFRAIVGRAIAKGRDARSDMGTLAWLLALPERPRAEGLSRYAHIRLGLASCQTLLDEYMASLEVK